MNCLRLDATKGRLVLKNCEIPKIEKPEEIVVKVALAGLCGTDLHIIENKFKAKDGVVLGHEFVGIVYQVPKNSAFQVGDRVFVNPNITCGVCRYCRRSLFNFCEEGGLKYTIGISVDGGFAEYCKVHHSLVFKLPDKVQFAQAVLAEPLSCITHGLDTMGPVELGSKILIIGAGITGLLWSSVFHFMGHRNVTVVQRSVARIESFVKLGTGYPVMSWDDLLDRHKKSNDVKFDVIVDTSGNPKAMENAFCLLDVGGRLVIFGVSDPSLCLKLSPFDIYKKELKIIGTAINTNLSVQQALGFLEAMGDKYFTAEKLTMKAFSLTDYETAINELNDRKYTKIMFQML